MQLEDREGALKRCRTALASAEQAVHDARAKVRHMGSLDTAVSSLLARGSKGVLRNTFLQQSNGASHPQDHYLPLQRDAMVSW